MTVSRSATGHESDQALVTAYRGGDEQAAGELVQRHGAALGRYLYSSGAPAGEIDDLVQETFFRAFRALDTWRGDAAFRSWLFRIGGNLRKDLYRKEGGRRVVSIAETDAVDHADPEGQAIAQDQAARIRVGITRLPRLQREVFLLRVQEGHPYEDIARSLGTTPGAARVHYHHAVQRLKGLLT